MSFYVPCDYCGKVYCNKCCQEVKKSTEQFSELTKSMAGFLKTEEPTDNLIVDIDDEDIKNILRECFETLSDKGTDYSAGTKDRLYNFRRASEEIGLPMRKILYIYLWKHLSAVTKYCNDGELKSESLKGRIVDAINYLLLLYKIDCEETSASKI
jgi:hypothetical protein